MSEISRRSLIAGGASLSAVAAVAVTATGSADNEETKTAGWTIAWWDANRGIGVLQTAASNGTRLTSRLIKLERPTTDALRRRLYSGARMRVIGRGSRPDRIVCAIAGAGGELVPLEAEFRCMWWVLQAEPTRSLS